MCDVRVLSVCPSEEDSRVPLFSISINGKNCETLLTKEEIGNYIRGEMQNILDEEYAESENNLNYLAKYFTQNQNEEIIFNNGISIFDANDINSALNANQPRPR